MSNPWERPGGVESGDEAWGGKEAAFEKQQRLAQVHRLLGAPQRALNRPLFAVPWSDLQPKFPRLAVIPLRALQVRCRRIGPQTQASGGRDERNHFERQCRWQRFAGGRRASRIIAVGVILLAAKHRRNRFGIHRVRQRIRLRGHDLKRLRDRPVSVLLPGPEKKLDHHGAGRS